MVVLLVAPSRAGVYDPTLNIGDPAPARERVPGVDGEKHSLADLAEKELVVVVAFTCNICPIAFTNKHVGPGRKLESAVAAQLRGEPPPHSETVARGCRVRIERERRKR